MKINIIPGGDHALFYSDHNPAEARCIGYVRFDFGRGHEFWHTWWPGNADDAGNTPAFKRELTMVINTLREGILKNVENAQEEISRLGIPFLNEERQHYGFHIETIYRSYFIRLLPYIGDYNYIYCYLREGGVPNEVD